MSHRKSMRSSGVMGSNGKRGEDDNVPAGRWSVIGWAMNVSRKKEKNEVCVNESALCEVGQRPEKTSHVVSFRLW